MKHTDYLNFDLLIDSRTPNGYIARVTASPIESKGSVEFDLPALSIPTLNDSAEEIQLYGETLFQTVFAGKVGTSLWLNFQEARRQQRGLRIRLWLAEQVPELALIPWELLYAPDWNRFVTRSALTPIVRYIDGLQDATTLQISAPLRILVVISNPQDEVTLNAATEWQHLQDALADLIGQGLVQLEKLEQPTAAALQKRLLKDEVHIFHYIGHGYFDEQANQGKGEGGLKLENEQGMSSNLTATNLATLLHDQASLRLVFLNTCEGAAGSATDYFAGTAQKLIQQGIPAVVAMQFPVSDNAAIRLSEYFYQTLAAGFPLDTALSEARKAVTIQADSGLAFEWATPALFSRSPSNQLFTLPSTPTQSEELPFALHELFDLVSRVPLADQKLFNLYQQSLPPLTKTKAGANLRAILFDLWNLPDHASSSKAIVNFARLVGAEAPNNDLQAELEKWSKAQQPHAPIAPPPQLPTSLYDPCLQIELRNDPQSAPNASVKRFCLRIAFWRNGQEQNWYDEPQSQPLDKIPAILLQALAKNEHRLPANAAFEFLVPRELFTENLDHWEIDEDYGVPCGKNFPVLLRSQDRLSSPPLIKAKLIEKWQIKWRGFQDALGDFADGKLSWCSPDLDFKKLGSDLEKNALSGLVGLDAAPTSPDTFKALIIAGIPVALWPKIGALEASALQKLMTDHLALERLSGLPKWLQHVRTHAQDLGAPFAMLWDDPTRIPQKYRDEGVLT